MDLTGKLLIAMPAMADPRFHQSVIVMCAHSDDGAMGLIVNKLAEPLDLSALLEQLSLETGSCSGKQPVQFGGPAEVGRGFVLHGLDYMSDVSSLDVGDMLRLTATMDVLEDIAAGRGPARSLIALGYAGWGPGQLEGEIGENAWLVGECDTDLIFDQPNDQKWYQSLKAMGIDALVLSADAGHA